MTGQDILNRASITIPMSPTKFSTGSTGFRGQGKVLGEAGEKYQVQVTAVLCGSKPADKTKKK
ncbi:MAG: hypothetical protein PHI12_07660 [Dehalococcoidales bacterium]|nr:hypothetical protein [Dehalococcoidales bacterium]